MEAPSHADATAPAKVVLPYRPAEGDAARVIWPYLFGAFLGACVIVAPLVRMSVRLFSDPTIGPIARKLMLPSIVSFFLMLIITAACGAQFWQMMLRWHIRKGLMVRKDARRYAFAAGLVPFLGCGGVILLFIAGWSPITILGGMLGVGAMYMGSVRLAVTRA